MAKVIKPDRFAEEMMKILTEFQNLTGEELRKAADATAKETAATLRATSPRQPDGGDYAKSWTHTVDKSMNGLSYGRIVYAKSPHYRLTHLLEYGHALWQGGRAEARPHIADAEEMAITNFERRLLEGLKK